MTLSRYDYIIVGSGAGGGVLAFHLSRAGKRVLVLEAGQRWQAKDYPDNELDASARLMWSGGVEPSHDASLMLMRGRVLGGGTVINQCLLDRFDSVALDDWAERSSIDSFNVTALGRHYDAVEADLSLQSIPESDWNGNARIYADGFDQLGYRRAPLRRGQSRCDVSAGNDCMRCLGGCPRSSKQSMAATFLPRAEQHGLEIVTGCHVHGVVHGSAGVTVYGRVGQEQVQFFGAQCVLAAGTLGSSRILMNSGLTHALPALGKGFFCHPQFVTFARYAEPVDAHRGSFQALKSDDPRFRAAGFKLENVFMGPVAAAYLLPGGAQMHQRLMRGYRHLACIEVAVRDVTPGRLSLGRNGQLNIRKSLGAPERRRAREGLQVIRDIYRVTGAKEVMQAPTGIGLHLMGGCAQGVQRDTSVVNPEFAVHGMPRLHVVDGSLFPSAPGINPSLTIMALAHRAAEALLGCTLPSAGIARGQSIAIAEASA
ncbi:GMC family oxidoreductase [Alcanivorax sp. JB21]|uniref:GMC family oxidoreductase N-terminal domain-containing protein n=1 Tax=Alcanivorax limicola TaxID=2874102 RepID=UPI001CBBC10D|nr:GMC family oxidoreductase [Alcanivorax limicola]MBZ2187909.1 GMC family oxidoreductase [Alcanivorax limicola]